MACRFAMELNQLSIFYAVVQSPSVQRAPRPMLRQRLRQVGSIAAQEIQSQNPASVTLAHASESVQN